MPRKIQKLFTARETLEGAGVRLHRVFGSAQEALITDPFLLLDDFSSPDPKDYRAGFPWHPHRGIETVTYIKSGSVAHHDSIGNKGVIGRDQVQWMTAGSGIIHEEMPQEEAPLLGFQLWVNLPKKHKFMAPRYQDVQAESTPVIKEGRAEIKIICGKVAGASGPVQEVLAEPLYLDVYLPKGERWVLPTPKDHTVLVYLYEGELPGLKPRQCALYGAGTELELKAEKDSHFLVLAGAPLKEPIAWYGPIVMNTEEELAKAFKDLEEGTFLAEAKKRGKGGAFY